MLIQHEQLITAAVRHSINTGRALELQVNKQTLIEFNDHTREELLKLYTRRITSLLSQEEKEAVEILVKYNLSPLNNLISCQFSVKITPKELKKEEDFSPLSDEVSKIPGKTPDISQLLSKKDLKRLHKEHKKGKSWNSAINMTLSPLDILAIQRYNNINISINNFPSCGGFVIKKHKE